MNYLYADPVHVTENAAYVDFVVRLWPASASEVRVTYQTDNGTATYSGGGADYVYQTGTLIFAPGETSKTVRVLLQDGALAEPTELFWLDLYSPVNAVVTQRYTPALVYDNDGNTGTPIVSVGDLSVDERAGTATFVVWLDRPSAGTVGVAWRTEGISAQPGEDFVGGSGSLSFAAGERVKTVTVPIVDDVLAEPDEFFRLVLENPTGAVLGDADGLAMIGRSDGATVGAPTINARPIAVSEGATLAGFVVQLSAPSPNEVRVSYATDNGTATYSGTGADYLYQTGQLVFAPGETTKVIHIGLQDGALAETTEVFWLDLYSPVNAVIGQRYTPALVFDNDGVSGLPAISVGDVIVDEAAQVASFFVSLDRPSASAVTVAYSTSDDTATSGEDYRAVSGVLHFAPGEMVKTVLVEIRNDSIAETDERFHLVLDTPTGASLADPVGVATIGRSDGSLVGTPYVNARAIAVGEGDTLARFVVQLSAPSPNEVRVSYQTDNGSATYSGAGSDYLYQTGQLVFTPGETTKVVEVALQAGALAEAPEVFWLDLYSPVNAVVGQRYTSALLVDDDAPTGTPGVRVTDVVVDEKDQSAHFFVWLDRPAASTVTVDYLTVGGTARADADFRPVSGTLSFAPGEVVKTVVVDIFDDAIPELDERFHLMLRNPNGLTIVDGMGLGMIGRSDMALVGTPQVLVQPVLVSEADLWVDFIVQLSAPSPNEVRVSYQTDNGTATYSGTGADYHYQTGQLVFAAGETTKTVRILLRDDALAEGLESFRLDLYSPVNATVPLRYTAATIVDDDGGLRVLSHGISDDTYEVTAVTDRVVEGPDGGIDTIRTALNNYVLPEHVENLFLLGSSNIDGFGNAADNVITSNPGNNRLDGGAGYDVVDYVTAGAGVTVNLGNGTATGGGGNDTLISIEGAFGSPFADLIIGSAGPNRLAGRGGNDTIEGGGGLDVAVFDGARASFTVLRTGADAATVTDNVGTEGQDSLSGVERLAFGDVYVALDIEPLGAIDPTDPDKGAGAIAGKAYRLYQAAFARTPDLEGVGYWISQLDAGAKLFDVATGFIGSAEFQAAYGVNPSNETYVRALYQNVLGRDPDQAGYDYWNSVLNPGYTTRQQMLIDFAESGENKALVIGVIGNGFDYVPWFG